MNRFAIAILASAVAAGVLPAIVDAQTNNQPAASASNVPPGEHGHHLHRHHPEPTAAVAAPEPTPMTRKETREERHEERHKERQDEREKRKESGEVHSGSLLKNFDVFLDAHPSIESDLRANPQLANDPSYIKNHPDYQTFLREHPFVKQSLQENPAKTIKRETRYDKKHD
jgi:hypothetical protein